MKSSLSLFFWTLLCLSPILVAQEDLVDSELERTLDEEKESSQNKRRSNTDAENEQINRNIDSALQNYERLIQNQPKSQSNNITSRIEENEKLLNERARKLEENQDNLRKAKIGMLAQYMNLKKARDEGQITEKFFKEKEAQILAKYNYNVRNLENDIQLYETDIQDAQERLKNLREEQKLHKMDNPSLYKPKEPERNPLEKLLLEIKKHSRFKVKNAFSHASSQDLHSPGYNSNIRHLSTLYNQSMIFHELEDFATSKTLFYEYLAMAESLDQTLSEDDYFQACYLAYLTRDWDNVENFAAKISGPSRQELSVTFSDATLR